MSALAPYYGFKPGVYHLARYARFAPHLARTVHTLYKNRKTIGKVRRMYRAARPMRRVSQFRRAVKRRRGISKKRKRVQGAPTQNKQIKRFNAGSDTTFLTLVRKNLFVNPIRWANAPDTNDGLRQAPAMRFHVSGFKICATFRNVSEIPLHVHMALIQPKEDGATVTTIGENMLSDGNNLNQRYVDFVNVSTDSAWSRLQDCANLNKRKFNIMTHQRFQLNARVEASESREKGSSYVHFERYFPMQKKFEFESTSATEVYRPLFIAVWYETLFPSTEAVTPYLEFNVNTNSYVRNKN